MIEAQENNVVELEVTQHNTGRDNSVKMYILCALLGLFMGIVLMIGIFA